MGFRLHRTKDNIMVVVTGASGQLGRLVIEALLQQLPAGQVVAAVRNPERVRDLAERGVQVRVADYDRPDTLDAAFAGADKVLLISSSEVGRRLPQHQAAIEAAKRAGVKLLAYTSVLRADTSPLALAGEHKATEALLRESGLPYAILRNGWYTENYLAGVAPALQYGVLMGGAGQGRIASAARADYADAAAAMLVREGQEGKVYELAGDDSYTLEEFAAELARQAGKPVAYRDLPQADYKQALLGAGLPEELAEVISSSDASAAQGALFDDGRQLSALIGRPTTSLANMVKGALG
jgi:NAD(P)H dehydrogenase (quinone)